jgi:hypothetical protein
MKCYSAALIVRDGAEFKNKLTSGTLTSIIHEALDLAKHNTLYKLHSAKYCTLLNYN